MAILPALLATLLLAVTASAVHADTYVEKVPRTQVNALEVFDADGRPLRTLWKVTRRGPGAAPCWAPSGRVTAHVVGRQTEAFRHDPVTGDRWRLPRGESLELSISPTCTLVAETHYGFEDDPEHDGGILIRTPSGEERGRVMTEQWPEGASIAWSRDGRRLAVMMHERRLGETLRVVDAATGALLARWRPTHRFSGLQLSAEPFSPDGTALVVGQSAGPPMILDVPSGRARPLFDPAQRRGYRELSWSPDGRAIAAASDGGDVELIDPAIGYGPTLHACVFVDAISWSPAADRLAFRCPADGETPDEGFGSVFIARPVGNTRARRVAPLTASALSAITWAPDGSRFAAWRALRR